MMDSACRSKMSYVSVLVDFTAFCSSSSFFNLAFSSRLTLYETVGWFTLSSLGVTLTS